MARRTCCIDGCDKPAPWGLRFPGRFSDVPDKYRGYLWHCADHFDAAEARRDKALEKARADGDIRPWQDELFGWESDRRDAG